MVFASITRRFHKKTLLQPQNNFQPLVPAERFLGPHIFLVRQAETIADVFPDWIQRCELDTPFYVPFDLNMPISLPRRASMKLAYEVDPPLSEIGKICCQMLARDLVIRKGVPIQAIYCSPSLAAIQTSQEITHYMGAHCGPIRVNPDLCANRRASNYWLTGHQLHNLGYLVDDEYEPMAAMDAAKSVESMQSILKSFVTEVANLSSNVMIVADALTVKCISDSANSIVRVDDLQTAYDVAELSFPPGSSCTLKPIHCKDQILIEPSSTRIRPIKAIGMSTGQNKELEINYT